MSFSTKSPIGVFDSGVGGLTVAKEIITELPGERIIYFGDTARVPYGNKSKETIIRYSTQIVQFLEAHEVKAIVIACNTATAFALDYLREELSKREQPLLIMGVIEAGASVAAKTTKNGRVGVIATDGTISSNVYKNLLSTYQIAAFPSSGEKPGLANAGKNTCDIKQIQVFQKACPLFVPLVEEGFAGDEVAKTIAQKYLNELIISDIDTLILGCTHYPHLSKTISEVMGPDVTLVNPARETAKRLRSELSREGLLNMDSCRNSNDHQFFVSDGAEKFKQFAKTMLPYELIQIDDVQLKVFE